MNKKQVIDIGSSKQLFFDNYLIEDMAGINRKYFKIQKYADNPVMKGDREWEVSHGPELFGTVMFDDDMNKYRMWYTVPKQLDQGDMDYDSKYKKFVIYAYYICYAESIDGIEWSKPDLGLYRFKDNKHNNIVMMGNICACGPSVYKDDNAKDPDKRYIMTYLDDGVCVAFSSDGINWVKHNDNPVIPGLNDTHISLAKKDTQWIMYLRPNVYAGNWKRRVAYTLSSDLTNWTEPSVIIIPDGHNPSEVYGMPVCNYEGIYLGFAQNFYSSESSTLDIDLMYSRNGIDFSKTGSPFIPLGEIGDFDSHMIYSADRFIEDGDELRIYYAGKNARHNDAFEKKTSCVGFGHIRKDGFVALDATDAKTLSKMSLTAMKEDRTTIEEEAVILTRPFTFTGKHLYINAFAPKGYLKIEILDVSTPISHAHPGPSHEEPFASFSMDKCDTFRTDETAHKMSWSGFDDLSGINNTPIRLKIAMRGSRLFSIQFK